MKIQYYKHDKSLPDLEFKNGYGNSVAIDLYTAEDIIIGDFQSALVSLGISMNIPSGYKADIRMRSSTFKKYGLIQTNAIGLIDTTYNGINDIWKLPIYKLPINWTGGAFSNRITIPKGTALCQLEIVKCMDNMELEPLLLSEYKELVGENNRGGFGSTDYIGGDI